MLLKGIMDLYSENHKKPRTALWEKFKVIEY
jgi:hypothetical protein